MKKSENKMSLKRKRLKSFKIRIDRIQLKEKERKGEKRRKYRFFF